MVQKVADLLVLAASTTSYSQAISMEDADALSVLVTLIYASSSLSTDDINPSYSPRGRREAAEAEPMTGAPPEYRVKACPEARRTRDEEVRRSAARIGGRSRRSGEYDGIKVSVERSDDLTNWSEESADVIKFGGTSSPPASKDAKVTGPITAQFVRLKFSNASATASVVLSASVNVKRLS